MKPVMEARRPVVLVVDDERDLRDVVEFNLRQAGYRTAAAGTGAEALALATVAEPPRIVVLDLNLPDLSGTEVCRRLRRDPRTESMGVLMLTERASSSRRSAVSAIVSPENL